MIGAALCGISAGFIWIAQGKYIKNLGKSTHNQSLYFGIFFSIFSFGCLIYKYFYYFKNYNVFL